MIWLILGAILVALLLFVIWLATFGKAAVED